MSGVRFPPRPPKFNAQLFSVGRFHFQGPRHNANDMASRTDRLTIAAAPMSTLPVLRTRSCSPLIAWSVASCASGADWRGGARETLTDAHANKKSQHCCGIRGPISKPIPSSLRVLPPCRVALLNCLSYACDGGRYAHLFLLHHTVLLVDLYFRQSGVDPYLPLRANREHMHSSVP